MKKKVKNADNRDRVKQINKWTERGRERKEKNVQVSHMFTQDAGRQGERRRKTSSLANE